MTWRSTRAKKTLPDSFTSYQDKFLSLLMKAGDDECWRMNVGINIDPLQKYCTFTYRHPNTDTYKTYIGRKVCYELFIGEVEPAKVIIATCGNIGCVNPKHLALATRGEVASKHRGKYEKNYDVHK